MAVALCQKVSWKTLACCVLLAGSAPPALAQFKLQESFEGTTAPGWTLSNSAILTAPSIDTAGSGWLRLTPTARTTKDLALTPAVAPAISYTVTAQFRSAAGQPFQTLFSNIVFPYVPPASLSVGFSGSTGGSNNTQELHGLAAATPDDLQVGVTGPASVMRAIDDL